MDYAKDCLDKTKLSKIAQQIDIVHKEHLRIRSKSKNKPETMTIDNENKGEGGVAPSSMFTKTIL